MKLTENNQFANFTELWNNPEFLHSEQKARIEFEVSFIGKIIEAREDKGLSQKQLSEMAGIKQSALARLESMKATPQIDTIFKVLKPLGYTLDIVPIEQHPVDN